MFSCLICSVGGSHEPILKAIAESRPEHIVFVCTDRDPSTGKSGSREQIEGKGLVIKAHFDDPSPTLPNIPVQANLSQNAYEVLIVPSDDLDVVFRRIHKRIAELLSENSYTQIIADYTGGTKTMTAGLVLAALEYPTVKLQLVTGARADLHKVMQGTERPFGADVERIQLERYLRMAMRPWERFAYDESSTILKGLNAFRTISMRQLFVRAQSISDALAAWDRFDHNTTITLLECFRPVLAPLGWVGLFNTLSKLCSGKLQSLMLLFDLWRNAQRRAIQGRYDDAVARCYRLLEASAQWLLKIKGGIDTADIPQDKIPTGIELTQNAGKYQAGLMQAWRLAAHLLRDRIATFHSEQQKKMLNLLQYRNYSILAHGWNPIRKEEWEMWGSWIESCLLPLLLEEGKPFGVAEIPPQLPNVYPEILLRNDDERKSE